MSVEEELRQAFADGSPTRSDFMLLLRVLEQIAERLRRYENLADALQERLLLVDVLPANAPFGALIRLREGTVAERTPLYLGNGPNQPLSKLTPTPL